MKRVGQGARPLKLQAVCLVERFSEVGLQTPSSSSPQLLEIQIVRPSPELPNQSETLGLGVSKPGDSDPC